MIVADVNVIAYFFIEGEKTALARELRTREPSWGAPDFWRHEFLNVLVSNCLFAEMPIETAHRIWADALSLMMGNEYTPNMVEALSLSVEKSTAAYDTEFIVLARALGVKCVTEDKLLHAKFPGTAISMKGFLDSLPGQEMIRESPGKYGMRRKRKDP